MSSWSRRRDGWEEIDFRMKETSVRYGVMIVMRYFTGFIFTFYFSCTSMYTGNATRDKTFVFVFNVDTSTEVTCLSCILIFFEWLL